MPTATSASAQFSRGGGTEENPYRISNCDQLQAIQNDLDAHYMLIVNIDCSSSEFIHIGDNDTPFTGSLDGNNKIIKDLDVDDYGLFGRIDVGQVSDLKLINPSVDGTTYVGSLAGTVNGEGSLITNVHVENGAVSGTSNYIGGLVGGAAIHNLSGLNNPVIEKNSYQGTVSSPGVMGGFIGTATGAAYIYNNYAVTTLTLLPEDSPAVGGFFGVNSSYQTANNYAVTTIDAEDGGVNSTVGGFVGFASGGQTFSFAVMDYNSGADQVGDFMGFSAGSTIGFDLYKDNGNGFSSNSANPGGNSIGIDTVANPDYFKLSANAPQSAWDFENTWEEVEGDYPRLRGEASFSEESDDFNGDSINDSYQATVTGVPDDEANLTVIELNSDSDCTLDPSEGFWINAGYFAEDPYFQQQVLRMTGFVVYCPNPGSQVQVTIIYPEQYDTTNSVLRFFNNETEEYHTVSDVTFGTREVGGNTVTTATYMLVDGSINDTDGVANGIIRDPVGIAIDNSPPELSVVGASSTQSSLASTGSTTNPLVLLGLSLIILTVPSLASSSLHKVLVKTKR
jgi:hypothetical protein